MTSDILNEHQRRHYHVLLSMLAQSASRVEALSTPRSSDDSALIEYRNDLPNEFAARIAPHLRSLRDMLARLATELDIAPKQISRRNSVRAILVSEIVRIEDSMAGGLRGYGEVDSRVRERLDPMLDQMVGQLRAIRRVLEGHDGAPADPVAAA